MSSTLSCKNCGNVFEGKYCNSCGQKADVQRLTWTGIFHFLVHAFFHLDDGFFYTIRQLATRPGHAVREYLQGKRQPFYNPFLMLVLMAGAASVLFVHFHLETIFASVNLHKLEDESPVIAHKFFFVRTLVFCLICSIGDYIFFRSKNVSFVEALVANVFMFSEVSIFQLVLVLLLLLERHTGISLYFRYIFVIGIVIYLFYCRYQFYNASGNPSLITRIILALITYLVLIIILGRFLINPLFN